MARWMLRDEVLGYIVNAYAGVEEAPTAGPGIMRRVWLWEEEGEVKMGNTEAFVLHLGRAFGEQVTPASAAELHKLMRDLGESLSAHKKHAPRDASSPKVGRFRQPDPDEWVISRRPRGREEDR